MSRSVVMTVFGTRPEAIKVAPVIRALREASAAVESCVVSTGQHRELVADLLPAFGIEVDHSLDLMRPNQTPLEFCQRAIGSLRELVLRVEPEFILVQGDTMTAFVGAFVGFHCGVATGHIEAGLRTSDRRNPFPEEMNRRQVTQLADLHFAATNGNARTLRREGIDSSRVFVTGNPVVDSLQWVRDHLAPSAALRALLDEPRAARRVLLTAHRRERFGAVLTEQLSTIRSFIERHSDLELLFPVHPNPNVLAAAEWALGGHPRIRLLEPLPYPDFIHLLDQCWLLLSDSGGLQEEAASLDKPLLVLRDSTERPEALDTGSIELLGPDVGKLAQKLESMYTAHSLRADDRVQSGVNPFGDGHAAPRIVCAVVDFLSRP